MCQKHYSLVWCILIVFIHVVVVVVGFLFLAYSGILVLQKTCTGCSDLKAIKLTNVTLHAKRGLIQISRYGYFHGPGREIVKNYWNVSEISLSRREKFTATVKYFTP